MKTYNRNQISLATLLGFPIGGAILMARNAQALGQPERTTRLIVAGLVSTLGMFVFIFLFHRYIALIELLVIATIAMCAMSRWHHKSQSSDLTLRFASTHARSSWGPTVGIGLLTGVCVLGSLSFVIGLFVHFLRG